MYCHVSMTPAVFSLKDTVDPDFGTWGERENTI